MSYIDWFRLQIHVQLWFISMFKSCICRFPWFHDTSILIPHCLMTTNSILLLLFDWLFLNHWLICICFVLASHVHHSSAFCLLPSPPRICQFLLLLINILINDIFVLQVQITLLDKNDSPPQFGSDLYELSVPEDSSPGDIVSTITAVDADETGSVEYSIRDGSDKKFDIDPRRGWFAISVNNIHIEYICSTHSLKLCLFFFP